MVVSGTHGRGDGDATRALQRAAPPSEALAWAATVAGARSVDSVEPMPGGASLAMHRVTVTFADGDSARLVVRRYVRADQVTDDPAVAAHEALVLELVERIGTPTPRLIGVDPTGEYACTPAVLMTELPGQPQWAANQRWMRQLVEVLTDAHAIDAVAASPVRPFAVYGQESHVLPKWATKPVVWERAIEVFHGPVPDADRTQTSDLDQLIAGSMSSALSASSRKPAMTDELARRSSAATLVGELPISQPDRFRRVTKEKGELPEVSVLRHDDQAVLLRKLPHGTIIGSVKVRVDHMLRSGYTSARSPTNDERDSDEKQSHADAASRRSRSAANERAACT